MKVSDLAVADLKRLAKHYITVVITVLFIWGIPYVLIMRGCQYVEESSVVSKGTSDLVWEIIGFVVVAAWLIIVFKNPLDTVKGIANWFTSLSKLLEPFSNFYRVIITLLLVGYFVSWFYSLTFAFWFSVLILIPSGFTYDEYMKIAKARDAGELTDEE